VSKVCVRVLSFLFFLISMSVTFRFSCLSHIFFYFYLLIFLVSVRFSLCIFGNYLGVLILCIPVGVFFLFFSCCVVGVWL